MGYVAFFLGVGEFPREADLLRYSYRRRVGEGLESQMFSPISLPHLCAKPPFLSLICDCIISSLFKGAAEYSLPTLKGAGNINANDKVLCQCQFHADDTATPS